MDNSTRSIHPIDYQHLPQSIGVMVKHYEDGDIVLPHSHERDQLLYAGSGIMWAKTESEAWIVPTDGAVYIPGGVSHSVHMHGAVEMCTLYIKPGSDFELPKSMSVLHINHLLRALILGLSEEPVAFGAQSRGAAIAHLIEIELARAKEIALYIPLPKDPRLTRLCSAILADPSNRNTLDGWSEWVGGSTRTLARLFDSELNMSFNQWRQRVRFYNALEALSLGTPVKLVAKKNGYRSVSAFSASFRKVLGMRPSDIHSQ